MQLLSILLYITQRLMNIQIQHISREFIYRVKLRLMLCFFSIKWFHVVRLSEVVNIYIFHTVCFYSICSLFFVCADYELHFDDFQPAKLEENEICYTISMYWNKNIREGERHSAHAHQPYGVIQRTVKPTVFYFCCIQFVHVCMNAAFAAATAHLPPFTTCRWAYVWPCERSSKLQSLTYEA